MNTAQQFRTPATTRDGRAWHPSFLIEINKETCIGCGRCYKVCGRSVMDLKGLTEDDEIVSLEDDEEIERKIMTLTDPGNCIGCGACSRVCPKNCQKYGSS
jgi:Nif-specific ferredoxin III